MSFSFVKTVSALPSPLTPNTIYAVRVGTGFDLYVSDMTGGIAHKLNTPTSDTPMASVADLDYWRETMNSRLMLYTQSRGQGLVSNGYGLMQDNTNFSGFVFDATDTQTGFGCFKTSVLNFNKSIDEFIAVNPERTYEFSFYAKTLQAGANNLNYAFIECFDLDKQSILPHNLPMLTFRVTQDVNAANPTLHIHPDDDITRLVQLYNANKSSTAIFYLNNPVYQSKTGFTYPFATYTRAHHTNAVRFSSTNLDAQNRIWAGIPFLATTDIKAGDTISLTMSGGSYLYVFSPSYKTNNWVIDYTRDLSNHTIPTEWTQYRAKFLAKNLLRAGTALIKIGWLLNRGSTNNGNTTGICAVEFREVSG